MYTNKRYSELVFLLEACESGSMFQKLPIDKNIYAVSAAAPNESSYGIFCPPFRDRVNGIINI